MTILGERLRAFMRKEGLRQNELALLAKVSQSTVSRVINGSSLRHGAARNRLLKYAEISTIGGPQDLVTAAFNRIWDGSAEQAKAVADIIDAVGRLRSRPADEGGDPA